MINNVLRIGGWEFFGLLILASAVVHLLFIFFFPAGDLIGSRLFEEPQHAPVPVVFEFVSAGDEIEELKRKQELLEEAPQETEEEEQQEVEEVKRQQFMDTADSAVDEEVDADTEMIGEQGTLARDNAPDEGPLNEQPRLDGDSLMPTIGGPPGEGPGYAEGFEDIMAEVVDTEQVSDVDAETEVEAEVETEDADITELIEFSESDQLTEFDEPEGAEGTDQENDTDSLTEDQQLAETETEDTTAETSVPEEAEEAEAEAIAETETPAEEDRLAQDTSAEVPETGETSEAGTSQETKPGLFDEELAKDKDGLLPVEEKKRELAFVPPPERQRKKQPKKAQQKRKKSARKRGGGRPKVAISFNGKSLSGGIIEPIYDSKDGNAALNGDEAFSVAKDEYAPYYRHIRDRVSWYWVLKYGTRAEINQETKPNTPIIIAFKVYPSGKVGNVKIVDTAGNNLLSSYIRDSITETRLNEFPSYVEEEFIDVRFNFFFF
ncbi:MAG: hypothetical protein ACYSRP_01275 [Planctomycetota bacterium]|jgi:outer membrane biosynthesis protein TonB